jgi:hypothetical protein
VIAQEVADNILPQISCNLLRALVPKADSPVAVNNIDARLQAIEDDLVDFRIVQFGHTMTPKGIIG